MIVLLTGCRAPWAVRDPEFGQVVRAAAEVRRLPDPAGAAVDPVVSELGGPHSVDHYVDFALEQNPTIQAARSRVEAAAERVPQAASLQDPMLGVTAYPAPVQTAVGRQEMSLTASQKLPWFGKLSTQASVAEGELQVARAQLASAELDVIEQVKRAYYDVYFSEQAIRLTEEIEEQLRLIIEPLVERRYIVERAVSQQDQLRVQVERLRLETELVQLRQQLESAQARLARQLHVSPDTPLRTADVLASEEIPADLDSLYRRAVASRPELHAALAAVTRDRRAADLARLNYYPDVTLGATWIDTASAGISPVANGRDAFLLTAGVNLPIYRKRLDAGVREAELKTVSGARHYDAMKDQTLEEVKDLFTQATTQQELLRLFRDDIIPKSQQTLEQSISAYTVGEVDILQLIDNWRQLLRFRVTQQQLEAQLRQTTASLARVVGTYELNVVPPEAPPAPNPAPPAFPPQESPSN